MIEVIPDDILLSSLSTIPLPEDFKFTIDGNDYFCQSSQICFVSPMIARLTENRQRCFSFRGLHDPHHYFPLFLSAVNGDEVQLDFTNSFLLFGIAKTLEIGQLASATMNIIDVTMSFENIFKITTSLNEHGLGIEKCVNYLAQNWKILKEYPEFFDLPPNIVESIIKSQNFQASSSDLFDIVHKFVLKGGADYAFLLKRTKLQSLAPQQVNTYIADASFNEVSQELWDAIKISLSKPRVDASPNLSQLPISEPKKVIDLRYTEDFYLDGVIQYLERQPGGIENRLKLHGGGVNDSRLHILIEYDHVTTKRWSNMRNKRYEKKDAWVMIELIGFSLKMTHYTLVSPAIESNECQPKSWTVEGSCDGREFSVIDRVINCSNMNAQMAMCNFQLKPESAPMRFFRFALMENFSTEPGDAYVFELSKIEIFGELIKD